MCLQRLCARALQAAMSSFEMSPMDEHNRALLDLVHPVRHVNPTPAKSYNMVVIGGGRAGISTAVGSAAAGGKVALVERHLLGGGKHTYMCVA
jgi:cation diffusion facilitator CzcD-associated flavoprotein CzcO